MSENENEEQKLKKMKEMADTIIRDFGPFASAEEKAEWQKRKAEVLNTPGTRWCLPIQENAFDPVEAAISILRREKTILEEWTERRIVRDFLMDAYAWAQTSGITYSYEAACAAQDILIKAQIEVQNG